MSSRKRRKKEERERRMADILHRGAVGSATYDDIDMLARMRREARGESGYFTQTKGREGMFHISSNPKREEGVFCVESNEVTGKCPLNPPVPHVLVDFKTWACWMNLAKEIKTEWIAFLKGRFGKDSKNEDCYIIESFYFPPQTASGAHVDVPTGVRPKPGVIGAVHSHVSMGVFFSGTDLAHSNWPVEIVINDKENYKAAVRYQLKCREWAKTDDAKVFLTGSKVSAVILKSIETAFTEGLEISKGLKVPATVHPDDQAEVAEALIALPVASQPLSQASESKPNASTDNSFYSSAKWCVCGHSMYRHRREVGDCEAQGCKCVAYLSQEEDYKSRSKSASSTTDTSNEDGEDGTHSLPFPTSPSQGSSNGSAGPSSPSSENTSQGDDMPEDPMLCTPCQGTGWVENIQGGEVEGTKECPTCNGDGLSSLGRAAQAEGMIH